MNKIFLSPLIAEPVVPLHILVHELVHAIDNLKNGHQGAFRKMATAVGLTGKMTSTTAELQDILLGIDARLGVYPHSKAPLSSRSEWQTVTGWSPARPKRQRSVERAFGHAGYALGWLPT